MPALPEQQTGSCSISLTLFQCQYFVPRRPCGFSLNFLCRRSVHAPNWIMLTFIDCLCAADGAVQHWPSLSCKCSCCCRMQSTTSQSLCSCWSLESIYDILVWWFLLPVRAQSLLGLGKKQSLCCCLRGAGLPKYIMPWAELCSCS